MAEYNNNNVIEGASSNIEIRGIALFPNNKTKENQPDYTGMVTINGVEHNVAFWSKTSKGGKNYLSGQITPKQAKPASTVEDDDSPF